VGLSHSSLIVNRAGIPDSGSGSFATLISITILHRHTASLPKQEKREKRENKKLLGWILLSLFSAVTLLDVIAV